MGKQILRPVRRLGAVHQFNERRVVFAVPMTSVLPANPVRLCADCITVFVDYTGAVAVDGAGPAPAALADAHPAPDLCVYGLLGPGVEEYAVRFLYLLCQLRGDADCLGSKRSGIEDAGQDEYLEDISAAAAREKHVAGYVVRPCDPNGGKRIQSKCVESRGFDR